MSRNPIVTSVIIKQELQLHCAEQTIRDFLHKNNIHCRRPAKKVELTAQHAELRVNFCRENLERDWSTVIFTDEKVFSTSQDTKKLVWRPNGTRFNRENIVPVRRTGRISLAYWGWMSAAGPGELTRVETKMNAEEYVRILEDVLLPSVRVIYPEPERIVLVQDNAAVHTCRRVRAWFDTHPEVELLRWPAKSPDLNPIENLWAIMSNTWDTQGVPVPRTRGNLDQHVSNIWEGFRGIPVCSNLVASMPRRLQRTIDSNGYWNSY